MRNEVLWFIIPSNKTEIIILLIWDVIEIKYLDKTQLNNLHSMTIILSTFSELNQFLIYTILMNFIKLFKLKKPKISYNVPKVVTATWKTEKVSRWSDHTTN